MKQLFTSALLLLSALGAAPGRAQGVGVKVGPKVGLAYAVLDGQINAKSFFKTGFSGGLMMRCRSSERFAIQPELLFVQLGAGNGHKASSTSADYDVKLNYFQLPLIIKIYIGSVVNVQFGPQVGLLLLAREVGQGSPNASGTSVAIDTDVKDQYYPMDGALCGGLGVDLHNGLVASARLNYGLVDISAEGEAQLRQALDAGGLHNRSFELSVGYLLGAHKDGE